MKTFTGWRAVGRAMRWAREQKATIDRTTLGCAPHGDLIDHRWSRGDATITVSVATWRTPTEVVITAPGRYVELDNPDPATVLGLLAALDLIPAELAEVRDERYGRCETCREWCIWVPAGDPFEPRWVHQDRIRVWAEHGAHRAQVADNNAPIETKEVGA